MNVSRSINFLILIGLPLLLSLLLAINPNEVASSANAPTMETLLFTFDFAEDAQGWVGGFADYPQGEEDFYELAWSWQRLPEALQGGGIFISGNNHSDDLFMFIKRQLSGLEAQTNYTVTIGFDLVTNVPAGCFGIGGAPGESVYIKAGTTQVEPQGITMDGEDFLQMNIDKGNQSQGGQDMDVLGNVANSRDCERQPLYEIKPFEGEGLSVMADENGSAWFIMGTDSGFEGTTSLYYTNIRIEAVPQISSMYPPGDVNCDNRVNSVDGLFILQHEVGMRSSGDNCPPLQDTLYAANCDVNDDTFCNATDALFVLQCDIGMVNTLCPAE